MAGRKVKLDLPTGKTVDGIEVQVEETIEKWTEVRFEDGTKLRIKVTVVGAARADNEYDQDGNPYYQLNFAPIITFSEVPDALKKKG